MSTQGDDYAARLVGIQRAWWKRVLPVQAPYQWNLRRQRLGRTLDVGCGAGRNLKTLGPGSVGVDHNAGLVGVVRARGYEAYTVEEFQARDWQPFDGLLFAHVIEHMDADEGRRLVNAYLPYLRPGGRVFFVCPQERGYASDSTHVRWTTGEDLEQLARECGLDPQPWRSFPFPRWAGRLFIYNEFTVSASSPGRVVSGDPGR